MPELPEVQATVDYLRDRVEGCTIINSSVLWHRSVAPTPAHEFSVTLAGAKIDKLFRRGKYVGIKLSSPHTLYLITHLRMSGSLDVVPTKFDLSSHDRVSIDLDTGKSIRFNDTRKFGRMRLCSDPEIVFSKLGLEPLEASFTPAALTQALAAKKGRIKSVLLDQSVVAGLGNIYVDEVLWKIKVHPLTQANKLSAQQIKDLHRAIQATLREAIEKLGCDFGDGVVDGGMYKPKVYGRTDRRCLRCPSKIVRIVVGQRGTHICPKCQARTGKRS